MRWVINPPSFPGFIGYEITLTSRASKVRIHQYMTATSMFMNSAARSAICSTVMGGAAGGSLA